MSLNPESTEAFAGIVSTSAEFDAGPSKLDTVADSVQEALRGLHLVKSQSPFETGRSFRLSALRESVNLNRNPAGNIRSTRSSMVGRDGNGVPFFNLDRTRDVENRRQTSDPFDVIGALRRA